MSCNDPGTGNGVMEYSQPEELDVPNPYYGKFGGETDQANASDSSEKNSPSHAQQMRKNTFPYEMENEPLDNNSSTINVPPQGQDVQTLYAVVDKAGKRDTITVAAGPSAMPEHNEYDVVERCNTTSSTSPAVPSTAKPSSSGGLVYSLAGEPMEGEVYNVAYPVHTPKPENSVVVDGYECLSNIR